MTSINSAVYLAVCLALVILVCMLYMVWKLGICRCVCVCNGTIIEYQENTERDASHEKLQSLKDETTYLVSTDYFQSPPVYNSCCVCLTGSGSMEPSYGLYVPKSRRVTFGHVNRSKMKEKILDKITCFPRFTINDSCPICLDAFARGTNIILLKCSHGYHESCILGWLKLHDKTTFHTSCPLCKEEMTVDSLSVTNINTPDPEQGFGHTSPVYGSVVFQSRHLAVHIPLP